MGRKSILCIDDDPGLLQFEQTFLEAFGFEVTTAQGAALGIAALDGRKFDAVVLDYNMPEMDGGEAASKIKGKHPALPIVLFSGYPEQIPNSVLAQVDAFVAKGSLPPSALVGVLERVMMAKPAQGQAQRRFPRYRVMLPFMVEVLRGGQRISARGVCNSLAEGGFGGQMDRELEPGDVVWLQLRIPLAGTSIEAQASVRYSRGTDHGFEFIGMSAAQKAELRRCCLTFAAS